MGSDGTDLQTLKTDENGVLQANSTLANNLSILNSFDTTVAAGGTITGTFENIEKYHSVYKSDVAWLFY